MISLILGLTLQILGIYWCGTYQLSSNWGRIAFCHSVKGINFSESAHLWKTWLQVGSYWDGRCLQMFDWKQASLFETHHHELWYPVWFAFDYLFVSLMFSHCEVVFETKGLILHAAELHFGWISRKPDKDLLLYQFRVNYCVWSLFMP